MAIDFKWLPEKKELPEFPRWWVWPLLLILFLSIGIAITFAVYISLDSSLSNSWFLAGALFIPLSLWIFVSGFWVYCLYYCQGYALSWNKQVEERYIELIREGQQGLYILFSTLQTEQGYDSTAQKITQEGISLQTKVPLHGTKAITHGKLTFDKDIASSTLDIQTRHLFAQLHQAMKAILTTPLSQYPIHVRFCFDTELNQQETLQLWQAQFASYRFASINFIQPTKASQLIDEWIDKDEDALLLIVTLCLVDSPKEQDGEAFSALLLAGEHLLSHHPIERTINTQALELVTLHRPEIGNDIEKVISHGVLWGAAEPAELTTIWYGHIDQQDVPVIATMLNDQGIKLKHTYHLDNTIGYTGHGTYFTAIALAAEHAKRTEDKQFVVCQDEEISACVVVRTKQYS